MTTNPNKVFTALRRVSQTSRLNMQLVLGRYGTERLLARLAASPYARRFVIKGATAFLVWGGPPHRATRDLDLLGFDAVGIDEVVALFREIAGLSLPTPDGLAFPPDEIRGEPIREGEHYQGVRVRLLGLLDGTRIPMVVDVGFGDVVMPPPGSSRAPSDPPSRAARHRCRWTHHSP